MTPSASPNNACDKERRRPRRPTRRSLASPTAGNARTSKIRAPFPRLLPFLPRSPLPQSLPLLPPLQPLRLALLFFLLLASSSALPAFSPADYDTVLVPKVKTSIYVGSVTLTMTPLKRGPGEIYTADYKATVVPFFMFNESGVFRVAFTNEQLARLDRGERVEFSGDGKSKIGSPRPITGHVTADAPGARRGKIKVRVFVTKKTALVFDTTYQFAATSEPSPPISPAS